MMDLNKFACCLVCLMASSSFGETVNHPGPYRRYSAELLQAEDSQLLRRMRGVNDYAGLSLDDPLLKLAYVDVFTSSPGSFEQLEKHHKWALVDMRRRGETVSPMLLKLAEENQETRFEIALLGTIDQVGTIALDPYLEYARKLLRDRTQTMSANAAAVASGLLAKHGDEADVELLKWVLKQRPYVAHDVTRNLKLFEQRLSNQKQAVGLPLNEDSSTSAATSDNHSSSTQSASVPKSDERPASMPWFAWGSLILVVIGIFWIFLKKCTKRRTGVEKR